MSRSAERRAAARRASRGATLRTKPLHTTPVPAARYLPASNVWAVTRSSRKLHPERRSGGPQPDWSARQRQHAASAAAPATVSRTPTLATLGTALAALAPLDTLARALTAHAALAAHIGTATALTATTRWLGSLQWHFRSQPPAAVADPTHGTHRRPPQHPGRR